MAVGTLPRWDGVRASQRETSTTVVKRRIEPGSRVVARVAGLGEVRGRVIWVRRSLEVLEVTRNACRGRQVVVIVHVAINTLPGRHRMHARQRERCQRMIE